MRRLSTIIGTALLAGTLTAPAIATPTVYAVEGRLVDPHIFGVPADQVDLAPGGDPGFNWTSNGIWHVRNVPVTEGIASLDGSTQIGTLARSFNFNLNMATGASTAWCDFTITLTTPDLGAFDGHCGGSLIDGIMIGNGPGGHMEGTYSLEPGGVPGVGPYVIAVEIAG